MEYPLALAKEENSAHRTVVNSGTADVQIWFEHFPLRPTSGWVVVAAILGLGFPTTSVQLDWRTSALLILLADPLWGSIWRLSYGRIGLLPLRAEILAQTAWLPYLQSDSPAAQLMGRGKDGAQSVSPLLLRVVLPTVCLTCAIAFVLGTTALWLTLIVLLCSSLAWIGRRYERRYLYLLHSVITISLPWMLVLGQFGSTYLRSDRFGSDAVQGTYILALLLFWTLHQWGAGICLDQFGSRAGIVLIAIADIGIGLVIILAKAPLWLLFLVIWMLPTWHRIFRRQPLTHLQFWWLLALLTSSAAVGQGAI
ncbi:hypothetical protein KFU94_23170 [Chloroflexi bacterium TSY]|nr:hypothetical protein [Chloroflexi bacterium TSY]